MPFSMPAKGIRRPKENHREQDASYAEQQAEQARKQTAENFGESYDILWDTPLNHFENTEVEDLLGEVTEWEEALDNAFEAFFSDGESK